MKMFIILLHMNVECSLTVSVIIGHLTVHISVSVKVNL